MPIYEYTCTSCGHAFEALVRRNKTPRCPSCGAGAENLERRFSLPNVSSETTRAQSMRAAKRRDKIQGIDRVEAQRDYEKHHDD